MIDTLKIYNELKDKLDAEAAQKIAEIFGSVYRELQNTVTKTEFNELKEVVRELAEAQTRTEERVEELAQAQKRTEERLEELAQAQKRTESELQALVREVREIKRDHAETPRQLGGLSATVGYTLENEAYKALPKLLLQDFGIKIKGRLDRDYIRDKKGQEIEVNILGKGEQNGRELLIVGEGKSQLSKNDLDTFIRKKLRRLEGLYAHILPVIVTHMVTSSDVSDYARQKGIALYKSSHF